LLCLAVVVLVALFFSIAGYCWYLFEPAIDAIITSFIDLIIAIVEAVVNYRGD